MYTARKITLEDRDRVLEISSKIWDGDDYIHFVFDKWVNDERGEFTAVLYKNKIIGFGKLTFFTPHDAWFEGLRKDVDFKKKGVGSFLTGHFLDTLKNYEDLNSVRFSTYFENYESINLCTKAGFEVIERRSHKFIEVDKDECKGRDLKCEKLIDAEKIKSYMTSSEFFNELNGIINLGWKARPYNEDFFLEALEQGKFIGITENCEIKAMALVTAPDNECITFFDAENEEYASLLIEDIKTINADAGYESVEIFLKGENRTRDMILSQGFKSWEEEMDFLLFEYPLNELRKR